MGWFTKKRDDLTFHYRQCPGCSYNFETGAGRRSCNWVDCPYLPEELKVFCPRCNFNFATGEGVAECGDPPSCDWAAQGRQHVANVVRFRRRAV